MIQLYGLHGASLRLLQEKLAGVDGDLCVSWGIEREGAVNGMRRLNSVEQLSALVEAGVPCVEFTTELATAREWVRAGELVFGRELVHTRGKDIVGPKHKAWRHKEFWTKVVRDVAQEWRVHIFKGRSIARGLKVQVEEPWRVLPVRNRGNGWRMIHTEDPPEVVRETARAAVAAVGYDFGAVDLLLREGGEVVVLEINTAPGLDEYTASAYVKAIVRLVRKVGKKRDL